MTTIRSNLHLHTTFSDGENTVAEYIQEAIVRGYQSIGISDHAPLCPTEYTYTPEDIDYGIDPTKLQEYIATVRDLQRKYKSQIEVYLGVEEDYLPAVDQSLFDYIIGSVHNLISPTGHLHTIDYTEECFEGAIAAFGSARLLVEAYYQQLQQVVCCQKPDIIGHLDIIGKLNWKNRYFSPKEMWYQILVTETLDIIAQTGCIVELNTSGLRKATRQEIYPAERLLPELYERKIPLILSSDAHKVGDLDAGFAETLLLLKDVGYTELYSLIKGKFQPISIKN